jgi:hypothetical protein
MVGVELVPGRRYVCTYEKSVECRSTTLLLYSVDGVGGQKVLLPGSLCVLLMARRKAVALGPASRRCPADQDD